MSSRNQKRQSIWLADENRKSFVRVRIAGVNMQGNGYSGFFFKEEKFISNFNIECSIQNYRWNVSHSFDDFVDLYAAVHNNPFISQRKKLKCPFPEGTDGDSSDVMVLVERKDQLEKLLQEVVQHLDCFAYPPLEEFLALSLNVQGLLRTVCYLQRHIRKYLVKLHLDMVLFQYYTEELTLLSYALEDGVEVVAYDIVPKQGSDGVRGEALCGQRCVLWLDVTVDEPGLSRICLVDKKSFDAFKHSTRGGGGGNASAASSGALTALRASSGSMGESSQRQSNAGILDVSMRRESIVKYEEEDERFARGVYLADVAEVRHGCNSFLFRYARANNMQVESFAPEGEDFPVQIVPSKCFSVVGAERTLEVQLVDANFPPILREKTKKCGLRRGDKGSLWRNYLVDFLGLLAMQSMQSQEIILRRKKWVRCGALNEPIALPNKISRGRINEGLKLQSLLKNSIKVDEELFVLHSGSGLFSKCLTYDGDENCLYIIPANDGNTAGSDNKGARGINGVSLNAETKLKQLCSGGRMFFLDDVSEVRPGKLSFVGDGDEYPLSLTIVCSETIITLPMGNIPQRDKLLGRFQAFIEMNKQSFSSDEAGYDPKYMTHHGQSPAAFAGSSSLLQELLPQAQVSAPVESNDCEAVKPGAEAQVGGTTEGAAAEDPDGAQVVSPASGTPPPLFEAGPAQLRPNLHVPVPEYVQDSEGSNTPSAPGMTPASRAGLVKRRGSSISRKSELDELRRRTGSFGSSHGFRGSAPSTPVSVGSQAASSFVIGDAASYASSVEDA